MSSVIKSVEKGSYAEKAGVLAADVLLSINGFDIMDVLDYRFYQNEQNIELRILRDGEEITLSIEKPEYDELGLEFETYLMDKQRSCKNKCIFCFIDQMPKGMRESLYFKDDDSRLSFLFGNYITLTNITEHEIERIIKMHISPVNISVHTTNPELRVKMMGNRFAGEVLQHIYRLNDAGISLNCQLVLVPGYNDGEELRRTLSDLTALENVRCIAAVPVGLTKHREGLCSLEGFGKESAAAVLDVIDRFGEECLEKYGERRVFGADEFYILSEREFPEANFYEDFLQLENGVGLWSLFKSDFYAALSGFKKLFFRRRKYSTVTGVAAAPLISFAAKEFNKKFPKVECKVHTVVNNFFGERITVAGLITGQDIIAALDDKDLGDELLIPDVMLRHETDYFLDDMTVNDLEEKLGVKVRVIGTSGADFVAALGK